MRGIKKNIIFAKNKEISKNYTYYIITLKRVRTYEATITHSISIGIVAGAGILSSASQANHTVASSATGLQFLGKADAAEGEGEEPHGYYGITIGCLLCI